MAQEQVSFPPPSLSIVWAATLRNEIKKMVHSKKYGPMGLLLQLLQELLLELLLVLLLLLLLLLLYGFD